MIFQSAFNPRMGANFAAQSPPDVVVWEKQGELTLHATTPIVYADIWIDDVLLKIRVSDNALILEPGDR